MRTTVVSLLVFTMAATCLFAQETEQDDFTRVWEVLEVFQAGYVERDTSLVSTWCDRIFHDNVEIIGTYSVHPDSREWFTGKDLAMKVIARDWIAWGDLDAEVDSASINIDGDVAWVSFPATVTKTPRNSRARTAEESASNMLKHIATLSESDDDRPYRMKLMEAAYLANLVLYQYERGDEFLWPIRISGVLQKKSGTWKFRQMHFSHPNRGFPNVRR